MSASSSNKMSLPLDCFLTSIAAFALLGQGSWYFAKHNAYEGWCACKTGFREAGRAAYQVSRGTARLFEIMGEIARRNLGEFGAVFPELAAGSIRALHGTGSALRSSADCVRWTLSPLNEVGATCQKGAQATCRALQGFWQGSVRSAEVLYAAISPFGGESYRMITSELKIGGAIEGAWRTSSDITKAALAGFTDELMSVFVTALEVTGKSAHAATGAIKSALMLSRESSYCLLLEAADTFGVGHEEMLRTSRALPAALQSFLSLPGAQIAALLTECHKSMLTGADESERTFHSIEHAATVGLDLLKTTLLSSLVEAAHAAKAGSECSQKAVQATAHAIDHGTEQLRATLLSLLSEGGHTLSSGAHAAPRAARATMHALIHGGGMIASPCAALLRESGALPIEGGKAALRSVNTGVQAIDTTTAAPRELAYRTAVEATDALGLLGDLSCKAVYGLEKGVEQSISILAELALREASELQTVAGRAVQRVKQFNYAMSHELDRRLKVHIYYPIEEAVYPKIQAIAIAWEQSMTRLGAIIAAYTH